MIIMQEFINISSLTFTIISQYRFFYQSFYFSYGCSFSIGLSFINKMFLFKFLLSILFYSF